MSGIAGLDSLGPFWERLAGAPVRALLLDYDGTLAPFTPRRDRAFPYPGVREVLKAILDTGATRLVIISGRKAEEVRDLLGLDPAPEIIGSHGFERLASDRGLESEEMDQRAREGLEEARRWAEERGFGHMWETKAGSGALHFRGLEPPDAERLKAEAEPFFRGLARSHGLALRPFDGGLELRARGPDKGSAVRMVLEETGENTLAAYLGDDLTDEDAFEEINKTGLSVLVRPDFRASSAKVWLRPPEELLEFLTLWARAAVGRA